MLSEQQPSVEGITTSILKMKVLRLKVEWIAQLFLVILLEKQWTVAACFFDIFLKKKKKNPPKKKKPTVYQFSCLESPISLSLNPNNKQLTTKRIQTLYYLLMND